MKRRHFVKMSFAAMGALVGLRHPISSAPHTSGPGRLRTRSRKPIRRAQPGPRDLGLGKGKDGVLSIPENYNPANPVPLIVMLHGAGGRGGHASFYERASTHGIAVVLPHSRGRNWDLIESGFGADIAFLDRALAFTFDSVAVDPKRLAIAGISDGASYALSVGLTNGDFFTHVMAYSPGAIMPASLHGNPKIFVAHGVADDVLPIEKGSRQIVPMLQRSGYSVVYREFQGGHVMKADIVEESFQWLLRP